METSYRCTKVLQTPAHTSALAFGHAGHLFAGCDDGTLRLYDLSTFKVLKAIRGFPAEISSIACQKRSGVESRDAWVACGQKIYLFHMDSPKMIMTPEDAISTIQICDEEETEDVLNEITLDTGKKYLAFSTDSGVVGVVDVTTKEVTKMKSKHENICSNVKFIPDRPREIVSSGYDETLLHFDCLQGSVLSKRKIPSMDNTVGGITLSPPFITSSAMSPSGVLAAGTADGRLWLGFGSEMQKQAKKRSRKWNGLSEEGEVTQKVADGPIVAMAFLDNDSFIVSTLLGVVRELRLSRSMDDGLPKIEQVWEKEVGDIEKVNALVILGTRVIIGGFATDGKGVITIWDRQIDTK